MNDKCALKFISETNLVTLPYFFTLYFWILGRMLRNKLIPLDFVFSSNFLFLFKLFFILPLFHSCFLYWHTKILQVPHMIYTKIKEIYLGFMLYRKSIK